MRGVFPCAAAPVHLHPAVRERGSTGTTQHAPQIRTCELLPWFSLALWDFYRHSLKRPAGEGTNRNKPASERPRLECHQGLN